MQMLDPLLLRTISQAPAVAAMLVDAIWEGVVLTLAVAICMRFLPTLSASTRSLVWMGTFLIASALPLRTVIQGAPANTLAQPSVTIHLGAPWAYALVAGWTLLSLLRGGRLLRSASHLRGIARRATPIVPTSFLSGLLRNHPSLSRGEMVEVCCSKELAAPSVVGLLRPRILLPAAMYASITPTDLEQILLHELEHLRRRDHWTNLLQKLTLTIFPLSPALFWIERRLCIERELACDDGVLLVTHARKAYATCLVTLAEQAAVHRGLLLALNAWQQRSELARRVERILSAPNRSVSQRFTTGIAGAVLLFITGFALVLTQAPPLLGFDAVALEQPAMAVSGQPEPVSSASAATPRPSLVRTSMESPRAPIASLSRLGSAHRHRARTMRPVEPAEEQQSLMQTQLAVWRATPKAARRRLTLAQDSDVVYAAVRVANGWLFVQL